MAQERKSDARSSRCADQPDGRCPTVAIGASAGGISALQSFFEAVPPDLGVSYVVISHLDPTHPSELASILARHSKMPVAQVNAKLALEPDHIYVIAPDQRLRITDDSIETLPFTDPRGQRAPIDLFFRSLAEQHGDGFAVVLSGGGSDGAVGIKAIKESGGVILVQDPREAEYPSMPRSAIATGTADIVAPVGELVAKLAEIVPKKQRLERVALQDESEAALRGIIAYLRARTGHDFSHYKRPTIFRRLSRRLQLNRIDRLDQYLLFLRENAEEAQALFSDLLISVTTFFRDPTAFKSLADNVIPELLRNDHDDPIRVWVAGCATGEEAYSIAILLLEEARRGDLSPEIQIFATDLDTGALATAREACYPVAIEADVSEERLRRFFVREGDHYRIRREVRDLVVFASHSLLKDPPFSRLDLACCRNLLIYLERDLQNQVCSTLHYALKPGGFLFLGSAESVEALPVLFRPVDREHRIYRAAERPPEHASMFPRLLVAPRLDLPPPPRPRSSEPGRRELLEHRAALEEMAPASALVDETHHVLHISETAGRYLQPSGGTLPSDITQLARPELRLDLRAALYRAFEKGESTLSLPVPVQFNGTARRVIVHVRPASVHEGARPRALVFFIEGGPVEDEPDAATPDRGGDDSSRRLHDELQVTRDRLKVSREEYESANEELRAANEELQSINEEYRSTAEELETSKEELQSMNEELQTLNSELKIKLEGVSRAHSDLQNLMAATEVGTLFIDSALRIKRFTPSIADLFSVTATDVGRPLTDFTHRLLYESLETNARAVLRDLAPIEREVQSNTGQWYLVRLRPYRTLDDRIDGVVITFVDMTERKETERRLRLMTSELDHRVKNTLARVLAIVERTRGAATVDDAIDKIAAQLRSMGRTHSRLSEARWAGVGLRSILEGEVGPYLGNSVVIFGPDLALSADAAQALTMVLHELTTNAAKHGALSVREGRVYIDTALRQAEDDQSVLDISWREEGGPRVSEPLHRGSGLEVIEELLAYELDAEVNMAFDPKGFRCSIRLLVGRVEAKARGPNDMPG